MFSNLNNENSSQLNMTQTLIKNKIINNDKNLINNNCKNILDKFNSTRSLKTNKYQKVPYVKQINKKTANIFNSNNKNLTRNRNTSTLENNYNNRPNTILNLTKNQKTSNLNKKIKQSSIEVSNKKALINSYANSEEPLIQIKKKIKISNTLRINKNLSSRDQNQKFQKKIYSLKNNISYKTGNNIGLNSNIIYNPFISKNKEVNKKLDEKITERPRIKVNLNLKEKKSKNKSNFKSCETEKNIDRIKNKKIDNFNQNIYVNTINNKIDIFNNINVDSINNEKNNKTSDENRINKLNKNKIIDILNGKIMTNSFQKKSRNFNCSGDVYSNEICPESSDNKTSFYRLNLNSNGANKKLINFYNSVDNQDTRMTYHKKKTKELIPKKSYGNLKSKINNFNSAKKKDVTSNNHTIGSTTINNSSKNYIIENKNNIDHNITIDSYKKNTNLNSLNNKNYNGIGRTKYSNVYLRKKSGKKINERLKNAVANISKKINIGNKNDKGEIYRGTLLKSSKLTIKK